LEAMSAGLAVVSTDVGDVRDMVCDRNRPYVTTLGDDEAFGRALCALTEKTQQRVLLGVANRARGVDEYDVRLMVDRYRSLYSDVLHDVRIPR
jgi:L-malate glycosyltransferase